MWWIIGIIIYLVITYFAYTKYISKWDKSKFEKIYFSFIWPIVLPLYGIHYVHNNL